MSFLVRVVDSNSGMDGDTIIGIFNNLNEASTTAKLYEEHINKQFSGITYRIIVTELNLDNSLTPNKLNSINYNTNHEDLKISYNGKLHESIYDITTNLFENKLIFTNE